VSATVEDLRTWRAGRFALEHEFGALTPVPDWAAWLPGWTVAERGAAHEATVVWDTPEGDLRRQGAALTVYLLPDLPAFGIRLRLETVLGFTGPVRHGCAVTEAVGAAVAQQPGSGDALPLRAARQLGIDPARLAPVATIDQERRYLRLEPPGGATGAAGLDVSGDRVTVARGSGRADPVGCTLTRFSTASYEIRDAAVLGAALAAARRHGVEVVDGKTRYLLDLAG
jgi:hypothetical protein